MTRLASRFGAVNLVRRDRPLTREELAHYVQSVFSEGKRYIARYGICKP